MNNIGESSFVSFIVKGDKNRKGILKSHILEENVVLSFYIENENETNPQIRSNKKYNSTPIESHCLSDFIRLEIFGGASYTVDLYGYSNKMSIIIDQIQILENFFEYLGQKVSLKQSSFNSRVFTMEKKCQNQISPCIASILPILRKNPVESHITMVKVLECYKYLKLDEVTTPIVYDQQSLKESSDINGRIEDSTYFFSMISNKIIDNTLKFGILEMCIDNTLLPMTNQERDFKRNANSFLYNDIKQQWLLITDRQWKNLRDLKLFMNRIESEINNYASFFDVYENSIHVKRIVFHILLSFAVYSWDKASSVSNLVVYICSFVNCYLKESSDTGITTFEGTILDYNRFESDIFWAFYTYFGKHCLFDLLSPKSSTMKQILTDVSQILETKFPMLLNLLVQKHLSNFDFFREEIVSLFYQFLSPDQQYQLIIESLSKTIPKFYTALIISILFFVAPKINAHKSSDFQKEYREALKDLNFTLLLQNTEKIIFSIFG